MEIHLYDPQGRHVGKNASAASISRFPALSTEREEDHSKNIVIHNADILANYKVKIQEQVQATLDLKVQVPDFAGNTVDNPQYLAVDVNPPWQAELTLPRPSDFDLKMDSNGDGAFEELSPAGRKRSDGG